MIRHAKGRRRAFATILLVTVAAVAACNSGDLPGSGPSPAPVIRQQIAVPAYFEDWSGLMADVPPSNVIVLNPDNGPGTGYSSQITAAHVRGARVLGYVYTRYANT